MLSVAEVAERCAVSQDAVRDAIRAGRLPATKVFGRIRITEQDLNEYIEASRVGGERVARRRPRPSRRPAAAGSLTDQMRRA